MNGSGLRVPAFAKWVCGVLLFAGALVVCGLVLKQPALRQSSRAHAPQAGRGFVNEQRAAQHDAELHESIGGRVTSVDGGDPISGAVVRFKTSAESVLTDLDGKFLLPTRYLQSVTASRPYRITAWKSGYHIGGVRVGIDGDGALLKQPVTIGLKDLPSQDNPNYQWVAPQPDQDSEDNCGNCHAGSYRQWAGSGHARAATNPHTLGLVHGFDYHGNPDVGWNLSREYPEGVSVCASCHLPSIAAGGAVSDMRRAEGVDRQGVHCDLCHKIERVSTDSDTLGLTHGRYGLTLLRPESGQLFFGSWDDVDRREDSYSALYSKSEYCAGCHQGTLFGVSVYQTYSEWQQSPSAKAGRQCQHCHMRPDGRTVNAAPGHGGVRRRAETISNHSFMPGGKAAMLRGCLKMTVIAKRADQGVSFRVRLLPHDVGHRVPTGFIDRHLTLELQPHDQLGEPLPVDDADRLPGYAGAYSKSIAGRVFGRRLTDEQGRSPAPFWRPVAQQSDTRLTPDQVTDSDFVFPPQTTTVVVRLLYHPFWYSVAQTKKWPDQSIEVFRRRVDVSP